MSCTSRRGFHAALAALVLVSLSGLASHGALHAVGVIVVNSTSMAVNPADGQCTLVEAINAANSDLANGIPGECGSPSGEDTIQLPAGVFTLDTVNEVMFGLPYGLPVIRTWMKIEGAGPGQTIVERGSAPGTPDFGLMMVMFGGSADPQQHGKLTLRGVTMRNGRTAFGGALYSDSYTTTIVNCAFENNTSLARDGGALFVASADISDSTFTGNFGTASGGAAFHQGLLTIRSSTFTSNRTNGPGGAIQGGNGSTLDVANSLFTDNSSRSAGGAINGGGGGVTIAHSTFVRNTAGAEGGGVYALRLTMSDSMIADNTAGSYGGGVAIVPTDSAWAVISDTTISRNNSSGGGGGLSGPNLYLSNLTVSQNVGYITGGGIAATGAFEGNNLTVVDNDLTASSGYGGGLAVDYTTSVSLANSIIAGNATGSAGSSPDCFAWAGKLTSTGHNLIGNTCGCGIVPAAGDLLGTWDSPIDPRMGPLQNNGGLAATHLPLPASPVIDTASPLLPGSGGGACQATDEGGIARPIDGNGDGVPISDRGAAESAGNAFPTRPGFSMSSYSVDEPAGTAAIAVVRDDPTGDVDVRYAASAGSATDAADFTAAAGVLHFVSGETTKTLDVQILDDSALEGTESVRLSLWRIDDPATAVPYSTAVLFIKDDEAIPLASVGDVSVTEGDGGTTDVHVTVRLTKSYSSNVTVEYGTVNGDAIAGQDYDAASGSIVIAAGNTSGDIVLRVRGDVVDEIDERFTLRIWTNVGCIGEHRSATITIVDNEVPNQPPALQNPGARINAEGDAVVLALQASDPDHDTLTFTAAGLPPGLTIDSASGSISGALPFDAAGSYLVTATVDDGNGASASVTFAWTVTDTNRPPTLANPGNQTNAETDMVALALTATDPDSDTLTFSAAGLPPGLSIDSASGVIAGTLPYTAAGTYAVTVTVDDGRGGTASQGFAWTVTNRNRPPTAVGDGPYQSLAGAAIAMNAGASSDPDGDPLTYTWTFGDGSPAVTTAQSAISHTYVSAGSYPVTVTVSDGAASSGPYTTTATVTAPPSNQNHAPICSAAQAGPQLWPPNHKLVPIAIAGVTDPDHDAVTLKVLSIFQDEPTNGGGDGSTAIDGYGVGTKQASVRAERSGRRNGRVYHIRFSASDPSGASCQGEVAVGVPHDQGRQKIAVDDGPLYDSTKATAPVDEDEHRW